ncbi:DUF952 domain-containing protein [Nocardioides acrostichi]|uniref:DUF952 domain-containing protein n=1 Tax=Nocardioides acrostichi TaxID=2784339 RepID=A0A930YBT3_9ACTN|nr:DUF952 domain-containing protein [Nocardioides acrostichi]MBF4162803.1 DUF952 domain-containing protein [Nocardioides acrostichi]
MRIFHIATEADWLAARESGTYTTSTLGRSLADEGFIHASREDQWRGVYTRFYAQLDEPLLLLEIETHRLGAEVREERPADAPESSSETFPHVYGPLVPTAVLRAVPVLDALAATSFSALFLREVMRNAALGLLIMLLAAAGAVTLGADRDWLGGWGAFVGALLGAALGVLGVRILGKRSRRERRR